MDDLFAEVNDPQPVDPSKALESLVGEGKKFASAEALAYGKMESDRYIAQLQSELKEIRKELNTRLTAEQLLDKINERNQLVNNQGNQSGNQPDLGDRANPTGGLTEEAIATLVDKHLATHREKSREQANTAIVVQELKKTLGNDYVRHMEARIQELGISKEDATRMASTMPQAFVELIAKTKAPAASGLPPRTSVNTNVSDYNAGGVKDFSYYEKMRKSPDKAIQRLYWTPKIQNEMAIAKATLGDAFGN